MINVNITKDSFEDLKEGYILEEKNDILTIRNTCRKPLAEIMNFVKTNEVLQNNEILLSTEETFIWCNGIKKAYECLKGKERGICIVATQYISRRFPAVEKPIFVKNP